jgi:hypothetical protein
MMIFASKQALLTQAEWLLHRSTNDAGDRSDVLSQAAQAGGSRHGGQGADRNAAAGQQLRLGHRRLHLCANWV